MKTLRGWREGQVGFATVKVAVLPFAAAFYEADLDAGMAAQIVRQEWRKQAFDNLWRSTDAERSNLSAFERTCPLANSINVGQQPASSPRHNQIVRSAQNQEYQR